MYNKYKEFLELSKYRDIHEEFLKFHLDVSVDIKTTTPGKIGVELFDDSTGYLEEYYAMGLPSMQNEIDHLVNLLESYAREIWDEAYTEDILESFMGEHNTINIREAIKMNVQTNLKREYSIEYTRVIKRDLLVKFGILEEV